MVTSFEGGETSKKELVGAILVVSAIAGSIAFSSSNSVSVHASSLWFVSYETQASATSGMTFQYFFNAADVQTPTITVTTNWGDGTFTTNSYSGTWAYPNGPQAYIAPITITHVYQSNAQNTMTITLRDTFGNSAMISVPVSVGTPQSSYASIGGHPPLQM